MKIDIESWCCISSELDGLLIASSYIYNEKVETLISTVGHYKPLYKLTSMVSYIYRHTK